MGAGILTNVPAPYNGGEQKFGDPKVLRVKRGHLLSQRVISRFTIEKQRETERHTTSKRQRKATVTNRE